MKTKQTNNVCPICGNSLIVSPYVKIFRCRYCRKMVKVNLIKKKGRYRIELEEEEEVKGECKRSSESFNKGLETDRE